ncbi:MAG: hypothetical protein ACREBR_04800 [bacterium]
MNQYTVTVTLLDNTTTSYTVDLYTINNGILNLFWNDANNFPTKIKFIALDRIDEVDIVYPSVNQ